MSEIWRFTIAILLLIAVGVLLPLVVEAQSHVGDCSKLTGISQARCERHERMYEKCHPIKGDAHFVCDSDFLKANPLDCGKLSSADAKACSAELAAVGKCDAHGGREFLRCVREEIRTDPRH